MATLYLRKLYDSFVPVDSEAAEAMEKIKMNSIVKCEITKPNKEGQRRVAQNRLYWSWLTDMQKNRINEYSGTTKEEWHEKMKRKFLINIYERDSEEFGLLVNSIRDVYRSGLKKQSGDMMDFIVKETSTVDATVKQFSEYLESIERYAHGLGIALKTDPEIYQEAMK